MSTTEPTEAEAEPPLLTRDFRVLLALQLVFGFAFSSFFLLPKFVVTELSGSPAQVGIVSAVAVATSVISSPLCGQLLDRGPRRPLIMAGAAVTSITAIGFLFVQEVGPYLYALRAVQGVAFTAFFVGGTTFVADIAPRTRLVQALGWFGCASLIMNAIAAAVAERIAHDFGWYAVFGAAAVAAMLATLLAFSLSRSESTSVLPQAALATAPAVAPAALPIVWATICGGAAFGVMFTFTQPFALELGDRSVSPLFAGYTLAALFVRLAFGHLAERFGRARIASAAVTLYALVVAATAGLTQGHLGLLGVGFGLAHGAFYPSLNALAVETAPPGQRGRATGRFNAAFNGGVLLVSAVCGSIAEAFGFRSVFLIVASLTATGAALLWTQARRRPVAIVRAS